MAQPTPNIVQRPMLSIPCTTRHPCGCTVAGAMTFVFGSTLGLIEGADDDDQDHDAHWPTLAEVRKAFDHMKANAEAKACPRCHAPNPSAN